MPVVTNPDAAMDLLRSAQEAFVSGNHQRAVTLALKALKLKPESTAALQIWGAASCYLKRAGDARAAAARLPKGSRDMLRRVCQPHGIRL